MIRLTSSQGIKRSFRPADIQVIVPKTPLPNTHGADCKSSLGLLADPDLYHVMETPAQIEALLVIAPQVLGRRAEAMGPYDFVTSVGIDADGHVEFHTTVLPDLPQEGSL